MFTHRTHSCWILLSVTTIVLTLLGGVQVPPAARAQGPDDAYAEALARIQQAHDTGATELDLSYLGLVDLPPEIGQLTNLTTLFLERNALTSLPPEIVELTHLEVLGLSGNALASLPPEIGQLTHLEQLNLDGNPLESPPPEIVDQGLDAILDYLREQ